MTSPTLTERYVAAAMRTVPVAQRDDLSAELLASIADLIDGRVEEGMHPEEAERAVLLDLGDPDKLAAGYTERVLWLIGPRYYLEWWRLLKLLLWILIPIAAFGVSLGQTIAGAGLGTVIGTTVAAVIGVVVHIFFWTTLVFALVERAGESSGPLVPWSLDNLPEPKQSGATFADMIASLVVLVLGAAAILWDLLIGFVPGRPELSLLDAGLWPWWVAGLFGVMVLDGILQVMVYRAGRWTIPLAVGNTVLALAAAVPALWLLTQGRLINLDFWTSVVPDDGSEVGGILAIITGFFIAGIAVWDIIDGFLKARRAH
ncbi:permease prefix domain 1-containing protein [Microbacterium sp. C7(2022)]|uniref:permease prefix domain 1-containing protein n=1 Tax=Microbacterium sp. C7(2022) TaxID=2992759 RepID=UPI00237C0603|nr:permease prefix domain 1-containing protein [Microbacterium sp. C7(2022)]MDE0546163.1 permease prefix domain 1-containing protein [Microbacterium sp. C7(2022)]